MAYPKTRSVVRELEEGMTDGKYRKIVADRGGDVEMTTWRSRRDLSDTWHGIHEIDEKMRPDGIACRTPYDVSNPHAEPMGF